MGTLEQAMEAVELRSRNENARFYCRMAYSSAVHTLRRHELRGNREAVIVAEGLADRIRRVYDALGGGRDELAQIAKETRAEAEKAHERG